MNINLKKFKVSLKDDKININGLSKEIKITFLAKMKNKYYIFITPKNKNDFSELIVVSGTNNNWEIPIIKYKGKCEDEKRWFVHCNNSFTFSHSKGKYYFSSEEEFEKVYIDGYH